MRDISNSLKSKKLLFFNNPQLYFYKMILSSFCKYINIINGYLINLEICIIIRPFVLKQHLIFWNYHFNAQYQVLSHITGVDYPKIPDRFELNYDLLSLYLSNRMKIKVYTNELRSIISSTFIYNNANWLECEIWDLFGVFFSSHPNLRRLLNDYGFEGYPLRKEFPLSGFFEVWYSYSRLSIFYKKLSLEQNMRQFSIQ